MNSSPQRVASTGDEFCHQQPIHQINAIQAHGVLLLVSLHDFRVVQFSENATHWLNLPQEELLDSPLAKLLTADCFSDLVAKSRTAHFTQPLPFILTFPCPAASFTILSFVHQKGALLYIETEFINQINPGNHAFINVFQQLQHVHAAINKAPTITAVAETAALEIKMISGFDRVMIYAFDEHWHGTVIAEQREEGMESYLGLRFPSTDIPRPARDLYLKNPYRIIADREGHYVPLVPDINPVTGSLTDLTDCRLRAVMPVHLEYLKNMQVHASMSTRIICKEQLWGLIACHHRSPIPLSFEQCALFEYVSSILSARINSLAVQQSTARKAHLNKSLNRLLHQLRSQTRLHLALDTHKEELAHLLSVDGIAICQRGEMYTWGKVPNAEQLSSLVHWLRKEATRKVVCLPSLSSAYPEASAFAPEASGLLALPVQPHEGFYILGFRVETIQSVNWDGNPGEAVQFDAQASTYHPRNSFRIWQETVRHTALPWSEEEIETAQKLRSELVEHTLQALTGELESKVQQKTMQLEQTYQELRALSHLTTHDVQEGIRKIGLLIESAQEQVPDKELAHTLDQIGGINKQMHSLILKLEFLSRS